LAHRAASNDGRARSRAVKPRRASGESVYNYFRDYDASIGRYIQSDPIGIRSGLNTYAYVDQQPLTSVDTEGLASCTYSISSHTLSCHPGKGGKAASVGPSGVFSGLPGECRNNPSCVNNRDEGPIPMGDYKMNKDDRPGHQGYWRLEPNPPIPGWKYVVGVNRCGFMLHPGGVSLGCITVDRRNDKSMRDYGNLNQLLLRENGTNTLTVTP
jgi:RHS repeat-associated protein